jgi:L-lactate dehydrogenase complex protein LldG
VVAEAVSARDEILGRIRGALGPAPSVPDVPRDYRGPGQSGLDAAAAVERFCERAAEYKATVRRVPTEDLEAALAEACTARGARRVAVPPGLPWRVEGVELVPDDPPLPARDLDVLDGVLTGSALAIAETGTIVLDGAGLSGRRALTLVPDYHLCVVDAGRIVASVPDAIAALAEAGRAGRPITFVSGPSATSDIELERVEGVHGPRTLDVLVAG